MLLLQAHADGWSRQDSSQLPNLAGADSTRVPLCHTGTTQASIVQPEAVITPLT